MSNRTKCPGCGKGPYHMTGDFFYPIPEGGLTQLCKDCHKKKLAKDNGWTKNNMQTYACRSKIDLVRKADIEMDADELMMVLDDYDGSMSGWSKVISCMPLTEAMEIYRTCLGAAGGEHRKHLVLRGDMWKLARNILVDFGGVEWPEHPHPELVNWEPGRYRERDGMSRAKGAKVAQVSRQRHADNRREAC